MHCQPRLLLDRPATPKVSVLLLDWGVRESFHALHYLNRQSAPRSSYELIWLEFYDHRPAGLGAGEGLDRWITLGFPREAIYHKHRLYNVGLAAARGEIVVICDSDAMFRPTFIDSILRAFRRGQRGAVHIDQVRNNSRRFYPFNYPSFEDVEGDECINWAGHATTGVLATQDRAHRANMGACMAARRDDILAIGGADEHLDYLGYLCGPYDITFRLNNHLRQPEEWLRDEYIHHTWHPNTSGINTDYCGPDDGRLMALRAMHARSTGRVRPYLRSPLFPEGGPPPLPESLSLLAARPEPVWHVEAAPRGWTDHVYFASRDVLGWNLFCHRGKWYGLPLAEGMFDPARMRSYPVLLTGPIEFNVQDQAMRAPYPGLGPLARLVRMARREPLHRLPVRAARAAGRLLGMKC